MHYLKCVTLKNFRCFREEQTARLAPLTLLVGENSTGKTSFLAMLRALWDSASWKRAPDFKEDPYDLGSFDEIAHHRGGRGGRAETFEAGLGVAPRTAPESEGHAEPYRFGVTFKKKGSVPSPEKMRISQDSVWIEVRLQDQSWQPSFGTPRGAWKSSHSLPELLDIDYSPMLLCLSHLRSSGAVGDDETRAEPVALQGSGSPTVEDWKVVKQLVDTHFQGAFGYIEQPFASAPVRSKPHRTYDPARTIRDPEGDYIPMYLASVNSHNKQQWKALKNALENFGRTAGLFDELSVKSLGSTDSGPFQVQIRKYGKRAKGPHRNLIDVGYGVSQVLPVITELLRPDAPPMFLLQQPEVHLHPSAQAALGSLFCQVASPNRQLVVETHSDHLLDRVRMEVRDSTTALRPEGVSILFFERRDLDVRIHSLSIDQEGTLLGAPPGYRQFFMEETTRSLWKDGGLRVE